MWVGKTAAASFGGFFFWLVFCFFFFMFFFFAFRLWIAHGSLGGAFDYRPLPPTCAVKAISIEQEPPPTSCRSERGSVIRSVRPGTRIVKWVKIPSLKPWIVANRLRGVGSTRACQRFERLSSAVR